MLPLSPHVPRLLYTTSVVNLSNLDTVEDSVARPRSGGWFSNIQCTVVPLSRRLQRAVVDALPSSAGLFFLFRGDELATPQADLCVQRPPVFDSSPFLI